MVMKRCEADLHFFDADKHGACPYCRPSSDDEIPDTKGIADIHASLRGDDKPGSTRGIFDVGKSRRQEPESPRPPEPPPSELGATVGVFAKKVGVEPVVGWLVCIEGSAKGKDYRIKPGINEVGRDDTRDVDIVITGDNMVSRKDHAEIEYDAGENTFYLIRKKNPEVMLNGKKIRQPTQLESHDLIRFGESLFIFVPLCTNKFSWPTGDQSDAEEPQIREDKEKKDAW